MRNDISERERERKGGRETGLGWGEKETLYNAQSARVNISLCVWLCWSWPRLSGPDIWAGVFGGQSVGGDEGMGAEVGEIRWLICITSFS